MFLIPRKIRKRKLKNTREERENRKGKDEEKKQKLQTSHTERPLLFKAFFILHKVLDSPVLLQASRDESLCG
jgi:ribosomal protein L9